MADKLWWIGLRWKMEGISGKGGRGGKMRRRQGEGKEARQGEKTMAYAENACVFGVPRSGEYKSRAECK